MTADGRVPRLYNVWHWSETLQAWYLRHKGLGQSDALRMPAPLPPGKRQVLPQSAFPLGPLALTDQAFDLVSLPDGPRDVFAAVSGSTWVFGDVRRGLIHCTACGGDHFVARCPHAGAGANRARVVLSCTACGREIEAK